MYIPNDIYALVMHFAYNIKPKTNIFLDLDFVISVKKHIPSIFFRESVPTRDIFNDGGFDNTFHALFRQNPFVKGNEFQPTELLFKDSVINTDLVHFAIDLLKTEVFIRYGTRRYFAHRTANALSEYIFTGSWRYLQYTKLFFMLSEIENYKVTDVFAGLVSNMIVNELSDKLPLNRDGTGILVNV